ncbi:MAG: zinc ribbon domain-containing protein [Syntrophales bacterium LBB04]|nr:zinc ribbon domain-containing protein [Syntrophales bacterium LBB04]
MPLYTYECRECGAQTDQVFRIAEKPKVIKCPVCRKKAAVSILSIGHGGIKCDSINDVKWMPSALKVLQPDYEKPIESRGEYNRYLKEKQLVCKG